jgi:hypothetical protein
MKITDEIANHQEIVRTISLDDGSSEVNLKTKVMMVKIRSRFFFLKSHYTKVKKLQKL